MYVPGGGNQGHGFLSNIVEGNKVWEVLPQPRKDGEIDKVYLAAEYKHDIFIYSWFFDDSVLLGIHGGEKTPELFLSLHVKNGGSVEMEVIIHNGFEACGEVAEVCRGISGDGTVTLEVFITCSSVEWVPEIESSLSPSYNSLTSTYTTASDHCHGRAPGWHSRSTIQNTIRGSSMQHLFRFTAVVDAKSFCNRPIQWAAINALWATLRKEAAGRGCDSIPRINVRVNIFNDDPAGPNTRCCIVRGGAFETIEKGHRKGKYGIQETRWAEERWPGDQ
ncbi:hypothetical protein EDD85DRAFT_793347 [Armillaria nabsnona]|nr:hypothetical protein EDD85DRAFT_793347 [Armillaria nabsnona]